MKIIKATEAIPVEHPVFCLFGQPGIGKTSIGYSTKEPLMLDFDDGAHRAANRRDTAIIRTWADVEDLKEALAPYSTVVVDTVGRCLDLMTVDIIEKNPKHGRDGGLSLQGFGALKSRFRLWISQLRSLGKDVVLIAHHKEDKDGDSFVIRPDITGSSYGEVMKISDFVGFIYMAGKDRILDFNPTERWVGKNPGGWKPLKVPHVAKAQTFLAELMDQGRSALGAISEESAKITQQVDDWRAAIETFTTADEINKAISKTADMTAIVAPQVKRLLMDRAKFLKFDWDTSKKAFVDQVPA